MPQFGRVRTVTPFWYKSVGHTGPKIDDLPPISTFPYENSNLNWWMLMCFVSRGHLSYFKGTQAEIQFGFHLGLQSQLQLPNPSDMPCCFYKRKRYMRQENAEFNTFKPTVAEQLGSHLVILGMSHQSQSLCTASSPSNPIAWWFYCV